MVVFCYDGYLAVTPLHNFIKPQEPNSPRIIASFSDNRFDSIIDVNIGDGYINLVEKTQITVLKYEKDTLMITSS